MYLLLYHTYVRVPLFPLVIDCTLPFYCYHYTDTTTAVRTAVVLYTEITLLFVVVSGWIGFVLFGRLRMDAGLYVVCHCT